MVTLGVPGGKKPTGGNGAEPGSGPVDAKPVDNSAHEEGVDRRRFLRTAGKTGVALGAVAWATPLVQTTVPAWAATGSGGHGNGHPGDHGGGGGNGGGGGHGGGGGGHKSGHGGGATASGGAEDGGGSVSEQSPADPSVAAFGAERAVDGGANDQGTLTPASAHTDTDPRRLVAFGGGAIALGSAAVGTRNRLVKPHHSTHDTPPEDHPDTSRGPA